VIESIDVKRVEPYSDRPYEWVLASARYAVDPDDPGTERIADISLAPKDPDGKVRFEGDLVLVRPTSGGNGRALLSVPNRGMVSLPFSRSGLGLGPATAPAAVGDGYLLDHGWTIAVPGWQWDVPNGFVGLRPPVLDVEPGWLRSDFRIDAPVGEKYLGDGMPGLGSMPALRFTAYPAIADDPDAVLRVRVAQMGPSEVVPRAQWRFTSSTTIALDGGFLPARWYELTYRSTFAPIVGSGLLALREIGSWLRTSNDLVFAHGVSQCGRLLREFLFEGLNLDEHGKQVFDGVFVEIASARRGEFNRRYAQPGLLSPMMPEYGPPYDTESLLTRQRARGGVPRLMIANSSWEYWRGDGALVHQHPVTGADLPEDPDARVHLVSGTDHLGAASAFKSMFPTANPPHNLDPAPVLRALFVQLDDWVTQGTEPEPSTVPRRSDATAITREAALQSFGATGRPDPAFLPFTPEIDPDLVEWPLPVGPARVALVSALDENGNELAGIRLPAVETGVAAYTGWNPRRHIDGMPDVLYDLVGSRLENLSGRPTPGPEDLRAAAERLVERRFLLPEDVDWAVEAAQSELPTG
jgi:Alpha/beta hydrolase domain